MMLSELRAQRRRLYIFKKSLIKHSKANSNLLRYKLASCFLQLHDFNQIFVHNLRHTHKTGLDWKPTKNCDGKNICITKRVSAEEIKFMAHFNIV